MTAQRLTLYGRKPVLEALQSDVIALRLHVAGKPEGSLVEIIRLARQQGIEIRNHKRRQLSFISKNSRQDQGVALDIEAPCLTDLTGLSDDPGQYLALDGLTNPQNLGMIVRSVAASPMSGLILPSHGSAQLDPLAYKASAGTLVRARIYRCEHLTPALSELKARGFRIYGLDGAGEIQLNQLPMESHTVFVLGNETYGLSPEVRKICDQLVNIPMADGIESLNVSAAATLVAFRQLFAR